MTARAPVYIDSGKLHVFEDGDTLPPWLSPSSMAWENLTGVPTGITQLAALTGPGYAKVDAAGAWSVQAAIPQADVSGLTTALAGLQPISARLAAIAGLTDAAGWLHDDGSGNWALTTPTKSDVGLGNVENTALSTWGGSANLVTLGTVTTGVWHGTSIADAYISSAATWNAKEGGLGNPSVSGQVLASTTAGARSWVSLPAASTTTPAALGIAAVGAGTTWARADHIHAMPTASQVGAEPALGSPSTSGYLLSSTSAGARSWAAPYSLPTATASVLGGIKVGTGLAISSGVLSVSYGTAVGTACVGNDSRLSNSRTPTAHALDGALHTISGKTAGQALVATSATAFGFVTISGDATLSGAGALTLASLLTAGSAGSATTVPVPTWDAKGRMTAVGSAAISIPHTQISDWSTATSSFLTANQSISLTGAVTGSGTTSIATTFANSHLAGIDQDLATSNSPTFGQLRIGSVDNPLIRLISDGSINVRAIAGHEFVVATPTDPSSSDGLSLRFSGSEGNPVAIKAGAFYASGFYEGGVALSSKYLQANQSISLTGAVTGSGTTSIATSFANTHLAGINQDLTTTSSPTFGPASLGAWSYDSTIAWFGASGQNNLTNGSSGFLQSSTGDKSVYMCAPANGYANITYNSRAYLTIGASGVSMPDASGLTVSGLITANGGISGNLTGHASLDIPLTGSSAITGSLNPIGSTYSVGSSNAPWGEIHAGVITANTVFYGNRLESTSYNILSLVGGTSVAINVGNNNLLNISNSRTAIYNPVVLSNTFTPAVITSDSTVTIDATYQGKMVSTGYQVNLPTTGPFVGFWFYLSWYHNAYQGWGPSGAWTFRGVSTTGAITDKFSGIVSWTGNEWVAG